ncbi:hypothetical protein MLD38_033738 [Melastoma candidum]|uniref:Uncharacterized protein n=1 Tax=Melastoma candidum TaxID=119954 RepID=A0ACB9MBG9_9MYRT|nr:hypothetical protein MLD38_033738 [Melastoma candidum]
MSSNSRTLLPVGKVVILVVLFLIPLLLVMVRSTFLLPSSLPPPPLPTTTTISISELKPLDGPALPTPKPCNKTPPSLARALVHYATTKVIPQQTLEEVSFTLQLLIDKSPCNFLVFGLGHDSLMWSSLNHRGRTVFLEEDQSWIQQMAEKLPSMEAYHVQYPTKVHQWKELMKIGLGRPCQEVIDPRLSKCSLAHKGFPEDIYDVEWDLIMVDAPTGYHEKAPGRMTVIYTVGLMAKNRGSGETDVFVHDVDRPIEDEFSRAFLCKGYMREQAGLLRHFTIPSHKQHIGQPFCPPS